MHDTIAPPTDDLLMAMRQFIADQGEKRSDVTRDRYLQVAHDLEIFVGGVDVTPWLGTELAAYLEHERSQSDGGLIASLGLASFIRVLPAFLKDPWLPLPGAQRKAQRAVVRCLMTFLRMRAKQEGCLQREDFQRIDDALRRANQYSGDHPIANRDGKVTCSVTVDLVEHLVDRMLEDIAGGRHESLDEAIAARINPVQVTVWRDPPPDYDRSGW